MEVLMAQGRRDDAKKVNDQILAADPKDNDALSMQAQLLLDKGDLQNAVAQLQTVVTRAPGNFVAHLSQSSPRRAGPERCKLFWAQLDLAFLAMGAPTDLERQRRAAACLSEADLSAGRFACQITLLDNKTSRPFQVIRQPFDQKFSFNFAIVSRSIDPSHKLNILDAFGMVSRLSR